MVGIALNQSKKVFLSPSCFKEQKILDHILKVLESYKFPEKNIIKSINMDVLNSGDYLVRCLDDQMHIFEVQLTLPFGFTTNLLGSI